MDQINLSLQTLQFLVNGLAFCIYLVCRKSELPSAILFVEYDIFCARIILC